MELGRRGFLKKFGEIGLVLLFYDKCHAMSKPDKNLFLEDAMQVGISPKSVEFNPQMTKAYVNNLEEGTIWVMDAGTHSLESIINYKKTSTVNVMGEDSFEEKPVETCLTHGGKRLWTSLHNSFGVTVQDTGYKALEMESQTKTKQVIIEDKINNEIKKLKVPFIETGATPKLIRGTPDQRRVCVANWHAGTVSVLDSETGKKYGDISTGTLPRGLAFTSDSKTGFAASFRENSLLIFDPYEVRQIRRINEIGANPRHILIDPNDEFLYIGFHGDGHLRKFNIKSGKTEQKLRIGGQVRSISATPDFNYIFATSFSENKVALINVEKMKVEEKIYSSYHPVGIAYNRISKEIWVTNQGNSRLNIFKFI
jgi:YVTN family beta-propeller protein